MEDIDADTGRGRRRDGARSPDAVLLGLARRQAAAVDQVRCVLACVSLCSGVQKSQLSGSSTLRT